MLVYGKAEASLGRVLNGRCAWGTDSESGRERENDGEGDAWLSESKWMKGCW